MSCHKDNSTELYWKFNDVESALWAIMASVIQGSDLGPFAYIVTASDLCPKTAGNDMFKSTLVIPASNARSRERELEHIQQWASENKLSLNKSKSQKIIFRKTRSRGTTHVPIIPGIQRVNSLKIIGVTLCSNFSMQEHVSSVISSSVQSLYALRVLRSHEFDDQSLQTVFQATVISKLQYASSAWWGFTNAAQPTGIIHSEGCQSRLAQKQLANTEC